MNIIINKMKHHLKLGKATQHIQPTGYYLSWQMLLGKIFNSLKTVLISEKKNPTKLHLKYNSNSV